MRLLDLHLGRPLTRGALTVFPIWNGAAVTTRGYDVGPGALSVSERDGGVVAELVLSNAGSRPALVLEGELLEGGLQHRVAAESVLVAAGATRAIDVRCVEQGRWAGSTEHTAHDTGGTTAVRGRSASARVDALAWRGRAVHVVAVNARHELVSA